MSQVKLVIPENFAVEEAADFREKLKQLINMGEKDFVLDFSKCTFLDSTGLGVLVSIYKKCTECNGSFKLHSLSPQIMKIFELTRLDKVFEIQS